jgi:hypothetical protein
MREEAPPPWDAGLMISYMDEAGIDVAVTSIPPGRPRRGRYAREVARAPMQRALGEADAGASEPAGRFCRPAAARR